MTILRSFARSDAARSLVEMAPSIPTVRISRVWRRLSCSPSEAMAHLADHLLSELEAGRVEETERVLAVAERFILRARPAYLDVVIVGLLESLHAGASHRPTSTEQTLVGLLPDACRTAWDEIRVFFGEVARWLAGSDVAPALTDEEFGAITAPEAEAHIRSTYWRSPNGVYVGVADVQAFQQGSPPPREADG